MESEKLRESTQERGKGNTRMTKREISGHQLSDSSRKQSSQAGAQRQKFQEACHQQ